MVESSTPDIDPGPCFRLNRSDADPPVPGSYSPQQAVARARLLNGVRGLIEPALARLKDTGLNAEQLRWVEAIEASLRSAEALPAEPLPADYLRLTPAELQIAVLIKHRKTSREIAELMHISRRTVEVHRNNIRRKLGITRKGVNLRTHLLYLG
jgi:DNA-binding CsgD family transcriptional regulator